MTGDWSGRGILVVPTTVAGVSGTVTSSSVISSTAVRDLTAAGYVTDAMTLDDCAWTSLAINANTPTRMLSLDTMITSRSFGIWRGARYSPEV
jgi:hypothetical protein